MADGVRSIGLRLSRNSDRTPGPLAADARPDLCRFRRQERHVVNKWNAANRQDVASSPTPYQERRAREDGEDLESNS